MRNCFMFAVTDSTNKEIKLYLLCGVHHLQGGTTCIFNSLIGELEFGHFTH